MTDEKKQSKAKLSKKVEGLVNEISNLSIVEVSQLVDALQQKLGISATAPVVAQSQVAQAPIGAAPSEGTGGATEAGTVSLKQTVLITASGENKIQVIKAIREINQNIGLKEAKDMTENLPAELLKDVKPDEAKAAAEKLKAAGATVEIK